MDVAEARRVLGVPAGASPERVRAAYRALLRRIHPDVNDAPDAAARTVQVTTAYAVLTATPSDTHRNRSTVADTPGPSGPGRPGPRHDRSGSETATERVAIALVDTDTIGVALPPDETLLLLIDTAHALGEVAYLDPSTGLVEAIVEFIEAPTSSVLFSLQGRATGITDVFCTVEPLSGGDAPPTDAVTRLVLDTMISLRTTSPAGGPQDVEDRA
jgi:hypothetical protein